MPISVYEPIGDTTLAGFPQVKQPAGIDLLTIEPGAITTSSPIQTPFKIIERDPMLTLLPMITLHFSLISFGGGVIRGISIE